MLALAEDHRNDIVSNLGAIAFGAIASTSQKVWWFDPAGAILISLYIIWSWMCILKGQARTPTTWPLCMYALQPALKPVFDTETYLLYIKYTCKGWTIVAAHSQG